jgi:prefoldin subunit 5
MVGLGILTVSLFIALIFAAYKYEQLEADIELYDNLLENSNTDYMRLDIEIIELQEIIDMLAEAEVARNFSEEVNE